MYPSPWPTQRGIRRHETQVAHVFEVPGGVLRIPTAQERFDHTPHMGLAQPPLLVARGQGSVPRDRSFVPDHLQAALLRIGHII